MTDTSTASSPLMDTERTLGMLLGLHAAHQARSTPLSTEELDCEEWLQADFFRGGLQLLQPRNPFEEEKGESRTPTSSATTPGLLGILYLETFDFCTMLCISTVFITVLKKANKPMTISENRMVGHEITSNCFFFHIAFQFLPFSLKRDIFFSSNPFLNKPGFYVSVVQVF